jgi:hypothetical protein
MRMPDVYTADKGQPPMPDEGPTTRIDPKVAAARALLMKKALMAKRARGGLPDVYTADKGQPPMPDEGPTTPAPMRRGPGMFSKGGAVGGASRRADGCAQRGKTKGRMI